MFGNFNDDILSPMSEIVNDSVDLIVRVLGEGDKAEKSSSERSHLLINYNY
jgi:hypothetical protein